MVTHEDAVSPVIGVMLMLVVTIIIAAVVSAFAGGLGGGSNSDPVMVKISGEYSQSDGFTFTHNGGDPISTGNTKIVVSTTDQFGGLKRWEPNTSVVQIMKSGHATPWKNVTKETISINSLSFEPGEVAFVNVEDLGQVQPRIYTSSEKLINGLPSDALYASTTSSTTYGFLVPANQGKQFLLQLIKSDRVIAETKVKITP